MTDTNFKFPPLSQAESSRLIAVLEARFPLKAAKQSDSYGDLMFAGGQQHVIEVIRAFYTEEESE